MSAPVIAHAKVARWAEGWELHIADEGVTQSRTLDDAPAQIRSYLATMHERDFSGVEVILMVPGKSEEVDLPRAPTLGVLTTYEGEESSGLGTHRSRLGIYSAIEDGVTDNAMAGMWPRDCIVSFQPMVPVAADLIGRLRAAVEGWHQSTVSNRMLADEVVEIVETIDAECDIEISA